MSKFVVHVPANVYDGKYYDFQTYKVVVDASSEADAKKKVIDTKDDIIEKASKKRTTGGKLVIAKPAKDNMFFVDKNGKPKDFYVRKEKEPVMKEDQEKSWKDRVPPDGHLADSYEIQVCDEGNKTIAVQMLDKAKLNYKISARKGQFYIVTPDMETFTQVRHVLNSTMDMDKEARKLGITPPGKSAPVVPAVTPIGQNTAQDAADSAANPVIVPLVPVKEETITEDASKDKLKREKDCAQVIKTSPFLKDMLKKYPADAKNFLDQLESAWDLGYDYGESAGYESGKRDNGRSEG